MELYLENSKIIERTYLNNGFPLYTSDMLVEKHDSLRFKISQKIIWNLVF